MFLTPFEVMTLSCCTMTFIPMWRVSEGGKKGNNGTVFSVGTTTLKEINKCFNMMWHYSYVGTRQSMYVDTKVRNTQCKCSSKTKELLTKCPYVLKAYRFISTALISRGKMNVVPLYPPIHSSLRVIHQWQRQWQRRCFCMSVTVSVSEERGWCVS